MFYNLLHCKPHPHPSKLGMALVLLVWLATFTNAHAAQAGATANPLILRIAVAANFSHTLQQLRQAFLQQSAMRNLQIKLSSGATGALYNQIVNGAPFDMFFAADQQTPALLVKQTIGDASTLFNYASGHLVLLFKQELASLPNQGCDEQATIDTNKEALQDLLHASRRLVIANPKIAPYGAAALDVLQALQANNTQRLSTIRVLGRNVMHAQQLFTHSDADAVMLSLAQLEHMHRIEPHSASRYRYCRVNAALHRELIQSAIQIEPHHAHARRSSQSENKRAAQLFMNFVQSPAGAAIIRGNGYSLPILTTP